MADSVGLHQLVGAVAGAIVDAQGLVEQRYIEQVSSYFDSQGNPLCLAVKMPRPGSAASDDMQLGVPLLSLVESSMLAIKDLKIELDVELGAIVDTASVGPAAPQSAPLTPAAQIMPDAAPSPSPFRSSGAPIDIPQTRPLPAAQAPVAAADPGAPLPAPQRAPAPPEKMLTLSVGTASATGPKARLSINVAAKAPSEAMHRLMTHLNKLV